MGGANGIFRRKGGVVGVVSVDDDMSCQVKGVDERDARKIQSR